MSADDWLASARDALRALERELDDAGLELSDLTIEGKTVLAQAYALIALAEVLVEDAIGARVDIVQRTADG